VRDWVPLRPPVNSVTLTKQRYFQLLELFEAQGALALLRSLPKSSSKLTILLAFGASSESSPTLGLQKKLYACRLKAGPSKSRPYAPDANSALRTAAASPRRLPNKNTTKAGVRPTTIWRVKATK
jgi:hypothetical protein